MGTCYIAANAIQLMAAGRTDVSLECCDIFFFFSSSQTGNWQKVARNIVEIDIKLLGSSYVVLGSNLGTVTQSKLMLMKKLDTFLSNVI